MKSEVVAASALSALKSRRTYLGNKDTRMDV